MHEIIFYAASALLRGAALFLLIQLVERLPFPALHRQLQSRGLWAVLLLLMVLPLHDVNFPGWTAASQADPTENVAAPSIRFDWDSWEFAVATAPEKPEAVPKIAEKPLPPSFVIPAGSAFWGLAGLYLGIAGLLAGYRLNRQRCGQRLLNALPEISGGRLFNLFHQAAGLAGFDRRHCRLFDGGILLAAPACTGFRRPKIFFPAQKAATLTDQQIITLFLHEFAHLKAGDNASNLLLTLTGCLFWGNLFLGWAIRRFWLAAELNCDREVVRRLHLEGAQRGEYARLLLFFSLTPPPALQGGNNLGAGSRDLKLRLWEIFNVSPESVPRRWLRRAATAALLLSVVMLTPAFTGHERRGPDSLLRYPVPAAQAMVYWDCEMMQDSYWSRKLLATSLAQSLLTKLSRDAQPYLFADWFETMQVQELMFFWLNGKTGGESMPSSGGILVRSRTTWPAFRARLLEGNPQARTTVLRNREVLQLADGGARKPTFFLPVNDHVIAILPDHGIVLDAFFASLDNQFDDAGIFQKILQEIPAEAIGFAAIPQPVDGWMTMDDRPVSGTLQAILRLAKDHSIGVDLDCRLTEAHQQEKAWLQVGKLFDGMKRAAIILGTDAGEAAEQLTCRNDDGAIHVEGRWPADLLERLWLAHQALLQPESPDAVSEVAVLRSKVK